MLVFESKDGYAALPGGSSELGERPEETAVRESFEETGLRIDIEKMVAFHDLVVLKKDGTEKCGFLHYLFLASTTDTNPRLGAEWEGSEAKCAWTKLRGLRRYKGVWALPEEVGNSMSEGNLELGDLGELEYHME